MAQTTVRRAEESELSPTPHTSHIYRLHTPIYIELPITDLSNKFDTV